MSLDVAYYASTRDPKAHARRLSWPALASDLGRWREWRGDKRARLVSCPLWSPVRLSEPRRAAAHVISVSALVLDYDDGATLDDALTTWRGYRLAAHTTWSHAEAAPRFRVVLPLAVAVAGAEWSDLYRHVLRRRGAQADRACCDPARAYYVPAVGAGGPHRYEVREGRELDLSATLERVRHERRKRDRERERRRREVRAAMASTAAEETRRARDALRYDPAARESLARAVGARVVNGHARRAPCPQCGGADVWWAIESEGYAACNHAYTCGYAASLFDYARVTQ